MENKEKIAKILSLLIVLLSAVASLGGLFANIYRDNALVTSAWKGNDFITLFLVIPVLLWSVLTKKRVFSNLVWAGSLGYMFYNYVFYLFGSSLNKFFLIYVALVALSAYALVFLLSSFDASVISDNFKLGKSAKWIAGFMLFFSVPWSILEISRALSFVFSGKIPTDVVQTGHPTAVIYAIDLTIVMPGFILAAIWLIKRKPWGHILSAIFLFKGIAYGLALIAMTTFAYQITGFKDPLLPVYSFLAVGSSVFYYLLIKNLLKESKSQL